MRSADIPEKTKGTDQVISHHLQCFIYIMPTKAKGKTTQVALILDKVENI
jgi:hypothetical protein